MAFNFPRPGAPHNQPLVDLPTARSAIAVAVINAGITVVAGNSEQMYYDVDLYRRANFATAVLGVALLVVGTAWPWPPVVIKRMVWVTKVLTGVTLTYSLSVLHSYLRMVYAGPLFDWLSHGFYYHFFPTAAVVFLGNIVLFYWVYCSELRRVDAE
jgi:hypothetical protein